MDNASKEFWFTAASSRKTEVRPAANGVIERRVQEVVSSFDVSSRPDKVAHNLQLRISHRERKRVYFEAYNIRFRDLLFLQIERSVF